MAWLRLTIAKPVPGAKAEVLKLLDDLENALAQTTGFILGGVFTATDEEVGRFSLWETRQAADRASSSQRTLALRSQLHNLIEPGHIENLYQVTGACHNIPVK